MDDPLHQGQAHARPLVVLLPVQSLEHTEQLVRVGHVEAHSVVPHEVDRLAVPREAAGLDPGLCAAARELQGVGQQVEPDLLEEGRVGPAGGQLAEDDLDLPTLALALELLEALADEVGHGHRLRGHRLAAQAAEVEQVVDQPAHLPGVLADPLEVAPRLPVQAGGMFRHKDLAEAVDGPQGARRSWETE